MKRQNFSSGGKWEPIIAPEMLVEIEADAVLDA
jgi:hypothetical protein